LNGFDFDNFTQLLTKFDGTGEIDHFASVNVGPHVSGGSDL
jgi:hypothetical protein